MKKIEVAVQDALGTLDPNYPLSENALEVLSRRYFTKDDQGKVIENWEQLCWRVANHVAADEKTKELQKEWANKYFEIIYNLRFLPNSPTFTGAGKPDGQLMACFVLPIDDHLEHIFDIAKWAGMIHKFGGGTGFSFSNLRPAGSIVKGSNGVASGPISFLKMYNGNTEAVKQGGTRRGANMGILRVDHPDILEFIDCKQNTSEITNFNISVAITDKFMAALASNTTYDIVNPFTRKVVKKLKASEVFDKICTNAWQTGEPGLFFIDETNRTNKWGVIEATNPCGEQPLQNWGACDLGSIKLSAYINEDGTFDDATYVNDIQTATRFLDSVVSVNHYPLEKIKEVHGETRKIGLGVMGFADALIAMGITYGSPESYEFADRIYGMMLSESKEYSAKLGIEKGICQACTELGLPYRNYWTTTIAPTGTISLIAGASSGIEPLFAVAYIRTCMDNTKMIMLNPLFEIAMQRAGIELTNELKEKLLTKMSIQNFTEIPKKIRDLFVTAADVSMEQHVTMQSIFQKHSDSGVSKTINLVESATVENVKEAYLLAHKLKCKGVTVYRDGSRPGQVLSTKKEEKSEKPKIRRRPAITTGTTEKVNTTLGKLYLTINRAHADDEIPTEVFLSIGKSGADILAFSEAMGRLVSLSLKYGIPVSQIAKQLKGIKGEDFIIHQDKRYLSIPDFIGRRLESETILKEDKDEKPEIAIIRCPECEGRVSKSEGCLKCVSCGWSKC